MVTFQSSYTRSFFQQVLCLSHQPLLYFSRVMGFILSLGRPVWVFVRSFYRGFRLGFSRHQVFVSEFQISSGRACFKQASSRVFTRQVFKTLVRFERDRLETNCVSVSLESQYLTRQDLLFQLCYPIEVAATAVVC